MFLREEAFIVDCGILEVIKSRMESGNELLQIVHSVEYIIDCLTIEIMLNVKLSKQAGRDASKDRNQFFSVLTRNRGVPKKPEHRETCEM